MRFRLRGVIAAVSLAACSSITSTGHGINVLLEANPKTAQVGDTVTFVVSVIATGVTGVTVDFGDATNEQQSGGGLPTVQLIFKHAYQTTGTYLAKAAVTDAAVGVRYVSEQITVTPRTDPPQARR